MMLRFACAPPVGLVLVSLSLPGTGSATPAGGVTVTVFTSSPVVSAGTVPVTVKVALVPAGSEISASMLPVPEALPQAAPAPLGVHVQVNAASGAGRASCTRALIASEGLALVLPML